MCDPGFPTPLPRTRASLIGGAQKISEIARKKKGVVAKPSLAQFAFPSDKPMTRNDQIKVWAQKAFPHSSAESIIMEQGGAAFVVVRVKNKRYTVCVDIASGRVEWTECM